MNMPFNKRSISPLIATILLIVVSVILVTVILTWGSDFAKSNTEKANTFLDQSKTLPKSNVFWLDSLIGNKVILKNNNNSSIEIKGYKILTTDFNSDYFWLNSYRPLENNVLFTAYSINPISLVCVPEKKFYLELIDINDQSYSIEINPKGNSSYIKCNAFQVPLWEFEEINGSYEINEFTKEQGELITNGDFSTGNFTNWQVTVQLNKSIVTGNGFTGNAARGVLTSASGAINPVFDDKSKLRLGHKYKLVGYFRSNNHFNFRDWGGNLIKDFGINLGDAMYFEYEFIWTRIPSGQYYFGMIAQNIGDWFEFQAQITELDPLPTITDGTKYLECTTAGTIAIPSKTAYGTWEFDYYKYGDGSTTYTYINFIDDINTGGYRDFNGYNVVPYSNFDLLLRRHSIGEHNNLISTSVNSLNTWYGIKITRLENGLFNMYIKGGEFGNTWFHLGSSINNLHTTSNYFVLNFSSGDKIANIKISPEIE